MSLVTGASAFHNWITFCGGRGKKIKHENNHNNDDDAENDDKKRGKKKTKKSMSTVKLLKAQHLPACHCDRKISIQWS